MATGFDVSSVIQNTNADGTCACDFDKVFLSCGRNKLEVFEALPATGEVGTTYWIGNNADGYQEYVWDSGRGFVHMGSAASPIATFATAKKQGFVKLSTDEEMTNEFSAGAIGKNAAGQIFVKKAQGGELGAVALSTWAKIVTDSANPEEHGGAIGMDDYGMIYGVTATRERYGTIKLGSMYAANNAYGYHVGVGASTTPGREGQLLFNLRERQSDGSPGCLRNEEVRDENDKLVGYELCIKEGTDSQMGIVKLCHALPTSITDSSFTGTLEEFQDAYMEARRNTHAASVGLIKDHLDAFLEGYFTDPRIGEFFSRWAGSRALGDEIWANEDYRTALLETVKTSVKGDVSFTNSIQTWTENKADSWLGSKITDEYMSALFGDLATQTAQAFAAQYLDNDFLANKIDEVTNLYLQQNVQSWVGEYFSDPANREWLSAELAEDVKNTVQESVLEDMKTVVEEVFSGRRTMVVDGEEVYFAVWAEAKMQSLVNNTVSEIENRVRAIDHKVKNPFEGLVQIPIYTNDKAGAKFPNLNHNLSQYRYVEVVFGFSWDGKSANEDSVLIDMREVVGWYKLSGRPLYYGASRSYHNKSPDSHVGVRVTPYGIHECHQYTNYAYEWVKGVYGYAEV